MNFLKNNIIIFLVNQNDYYLYLIKDIYNLNNIKIIFNLNEWFLNKIIFIKKTKKITNKKYKYLEYSIEARILKLINKNHKLI